MSYNEEETKFERWNYIMKNKCILGLVGTAIIAVVISGVCMMNKTDEDSIIIETEQEGETSEEEA
jgi:hypothetical protein